MGYPPPWSEHQFRRETKLHFSRSIALRLDGRLAGFAIWWQAADEAQIANIAVHADHRRRGYGRRLLRRLLDDAAARGLARVTLEVRDNNAEAVRLYEQFQFRVTGRRPNYYAGRDTALLMERTLP
jgi:ribosomal-protein-alanine N-acetyltransferase